eukprot:scaffold329797_cov55-Tisochrysis_lutea.AAC.1
MGGSVAQTVNSRALASPSLCESRKPRPRCETRQGGPPNTNTRINLLIFVTSYPYRTRGEWHSNGTTATYYT